MAAGTGLPPHLLKYWTAGPGAAKIARNSPGDFNRCRVEIQAAITKDGEAPLSDRVISGLCATLHKLATGATPGNAAGD
jgi:hypothetical protein